MNTDRLIPLNQKPALYESGTAVMWTDPYISGQLLNIHLNEHLDLASRKKTTINSTVQWIMNQINGEHLSILDLGCGPGLYAERLAAAGHRVTGVDFSETSIAYAQVRNRGKNQDIEYRCMNYLDLDFENQFDLVIMIFTDFGVLTPDERDILLTSIHRALKPGGTFLFDVLNDTDLEQKVTSKNREAAEHGFWKDRPYLVLSESFLYPEEKVILYQHIFVDETDKTDLFRFWTHFFSDEDLNAILENHLFKNRTFARNVIPESDLFSGRHVTFCVCDKID